MPTPDFVFRSNKPKDGNCAGCGTLWRCSEVTLPLSLRNLDNKSSSKENRIGAKFLHAIGRVVDAIKYFRLCFLIDFTLFIALWYLKNG